MSERISATRILTAVSEWRTQLWPLFMRERALVAYYNAGPMPTDEPCDDAPISLGLGHRYIKKPFDQLMDTILMEPGFIKTESCYPIEPKRKGMVESAADTVINEIAHRRMESTIRKLAGRSLIAGRAFTFRLSRWDWLFRQGRMLHDPHDGDDIYDESFREWAFCGEITLRQIDEYIDSTRNYDGVGWGNESLRALKKYILKLTANEKHVEKSAQETWVSDRLEKPFDDDGAVRPLDVYWYFRKNGERNDAGKEKIDLYCISRYGEVSFVEEEKGGDGMMYRALAIKDGKNGGDYKNNNQTLYYLPDAFESIDECLIPFILDSRVDGEQELAQIDGTGKIMLPRLASMENLAGSLIEGMAFGAQPNWTSANNSQIDKAELQRLQRSGIGAWDYVPPGIGLVQKNNSFTGFGGALQMLQMLGVSADQDAGTGEISPMNQSNPELKDGMQALIAQAQAAVGRRTGKFFEGLDQVAEQITVTLCRPFELWKKQDPAYYDVLTFQTRMLGEYKVFPAEYDPKRVKGKTRRLTAGGTRQEAISNAVATKQMFGGSISPDGARFVDKEALRAMWGDVTANILIPDEPAEDQTQIDAAERQNGQAIIGLQMPPRLPTDVPMVHVPRHMATLGTRLQLAQQTGSIAPAERMGLEALLVHTSIDLPGTPPQVQQQLGEVLTQMAQVLKTIPVQSANLDQEIKQRGQQLKEAQFQFSQQREQNLVSDRNTKAQMKHQSLMLDIQRFLEEQKNSGVTRAGQLFKMMEVDAQEPALPASSSESNP